MESEILGKYATKTPSRQGASGKANKGLKHAKRQEVGKTFHYVSCFSHLALAASEVLYDNTELQGFFIC